MKSHYLIKIVPPVGYRVFRLEFSRRHIFSVIAVLAIAFGAAGSYYVWTLNHAEQRVSELRGLADDQRDRLQKIDGQAAELENELHAYEQQSEQIRRMIGDKGHDADRAVTAPEPAQARDDRQSMRDDDAFLRVAARVERCGQSPRLHAASPTACAPSRCACSTCAGSRI